MTTIKQQARRAGLIYLLIGLIAPIGLMIVPDKLIVSGDATATVERIRASESLMRIGIASELIHQAIAIFLVLALYRLFRHVNETQARQVVILGALVSVPIAFLNTVFEIGALILLSGAGYLSVFDQTELEALSYFFIQLHSQGLNVASVFWALWLFPFGRLVMRSGFIPRVLGILMMVAGVGYLLNAFTTVLLPQYVSIVNDVTFIMLFGEIPIMIWLLIWGARGPLANDPLPA